MWWLSLFLLGGQPDVVVLLMDDVGLRDLQQVPTPTLDSLAGQGVEFSRAYAHPWCAPTRDTLFRGAWDGRSRGDLCDPAVPRSLPLGTPTLPKAMQEAGYETVLVGKWHLGRPSITTPWEVSPHYYGFDHWYAGISSSPGCLGQDSVYDGAIVSRGNVHRTVEQRDAFLDAYRDAKSRGRPFFGVLAFTDAHQPWSVPPPWILPRGFWLPVNASDRERYEAEIVALDFVIGQIVQVLGPNTWILIAGDNGTPAEVAPKPGKAKTTVFERGVRVPLIASGPGLVPGVCDDPVHLVDVWATLGEALGLCGDVEGQSLLPALFGGDLPRPYVWVSNPSANRVAAIETRWKLMDDDGTQTLYDLLSDPGEKNPLDPDDPGYAAITQRLRAILADP